MDPELEMSDWWLLNVEANRVPYDTRNLEATKGNIQKTRPGKDSREKESEA